MGIWDSLSVRSKLVEKRICPTRGVSQDLGSWKKSIWVLACIYMYILGGSRFLKKSIRVFTDSVIEGVGYLNWLTWVLVDSGDLDF